MTDISGLLRLFNDVTAICEYNESPRNIQKTLRHILLLTAATRQCLQECDSSEQKEDSTYSNLLQSLLESKDDIPKRDFCNVMQHFKVAYYVPGSETAAMQLLGLYDLSDNDFKPLDGMQTQEEMYLYLIKLWHRKKLNATTSSTFTTVSTRSRPKSFYQFFGLAFGIVVLIMYNSMTNQVVDSRPRTEISHPACIQRVENVGTHAVESYMDDVFLSLPQMLWHILGRYYKQELHEERNDQIDQLAKIILEGSENNIKSSEIRNDLHETYPTLLFPQKDMNMLTAEARRIMSQYYYKTSEPRGVLELCYWRSIRQEIRSLIQPYANTYNTNGFIKAFTFDVQNWFWGRPLKITKLESIFCELFQVKSYTTSFELAPKTNECYPRTTSMRSSVGLDSTIKTIPDVMFLNIRSVYTYHESKDEQIKELSNQIMDFTRSGTYDLITESAISRKGSTTPWKKLAIATIPELKDIPARDILSLKTRQLLVDYYKTKFDSDVGKEISRLYWQNFLLEFYIRNIAKNTDLQKLWERNTMEYFHGKTLSNPELSAFLCEMYQPDNQCEGLTCYASSLFFKKPSLFQMTLQEIYHQEHMKQIAEERMKIQEELKIHLPISTKWKDPYLKQFENEIYPLSTLAVTFNAFLNYSWVNAFVRDDFEALKTNDAKIAYMAKAIVTQTEPISSFQAKARPQRIYHPWFDISLTNEELDHLFANQLEFNFGKEISDTYKYSKNPTENFRMDSFAAQKLRVDLDHRLNPYDPLRTWIELYQLSFLIDLVKTFRANNLNEKKLSEIWVKNSLQHFHNTQLDNPELFFLLREAY